MHDPNEVLGARIWSELKDVYVDWTLTDRYPVGFPGAEQAPADIRSFVREMFRLSAQRRLIGKAGPVALTLDSTVDELLNLRIQLEQQPTFLVGLMLIDLFCTRQLNSLLSEGLAQTRQTLTDDEWAQTFAVTACSSWNELIEQAFAPPGTAVLCEGLKSCLLDQIQGKRLWDFYRKPELTTGYRYWWPGAFTDFGQRASITSPSSSDGDAKVSVQRYPDAANQIDTITPYEWQARLQPQGDTEPTAVACGMVYEMCRDERGLRNTKFDLRWISDRVADTDALQVIAFLDQHRDAEPLMQEGDLCFLWLWERRADVAPGAGGQLLIDALRALKRRFPRLRTLVVNLQPAQFDDIGHEFDPPELQVARWQACESIERLLERLAPNDVLGGQLRLIGMPALALPNLTHALR